MVKQAEKRQKRSPFLPILGLFLAVVGLAISWAAAKLIVAIPKIKGALASLPYTRVFGQNVNQGQIMLAFMLWLAFLAFAYFLVAVLAGKDPESTRDIPLPPKKNAKKKA